MLWSALILPAHASKRCTMKSENRLRAEKIMRDPRYYRDCDPDLMEQVHAMLQREPSGTTPVTKGTMAMCGRSGVVCGATGG